MSKTKKKRRKSTMAAGLTRVQRLNSLEKNLSLLGRAYAALLRKLVEKGVLTEEDLGKPAEDANPETQGEEA